MHRYWLRLLCGLAGVFALAAASPAPAEQFFFKDGDSVVIIGDSITEQRLYSEYVETWTVSRFPKWKVTFRNVGIGGDTSPGGDKRFERDVVSFKPTAMTVDFGMNDGGYGAFNEARYDAYMKGLQSMAAFALSAMLCRPTRRRRPTFASPGSRLSRSSRPRTVRPRTFTTPRSSGSRPA